jgi:hypothetical protein
MGSHEAKSHTGHPERTARTSPLPEGARKLAQDNPDPERSEGEGAVLGMRLEGNEKPRRGDGAHHAASVPHPEVSKRSDEL